MFLRFTVNEKIKERYVYGCRMKSREMEMEHRNRGDNVDKWEENS